MSTLFVQKIRIVSDVKWKLPNRIIISFFLQEFDQIPSKDYFSSILTQNTWPLSKKKGSIFALKRRSHSKFRRRTKRIKIHSKPKEGRNVALGMLCSGARYERILFNWIWFENVCRAESSALLLLQALLILWPLEGQEN